MVGSITHGAGHYAAAAAWSTDLKTLGIDVESNRVLENAVVAATSLPEELAELPVIKGIEWPAALFSLREAVFKAWYPVVGEWLTYHDVRLRLDPATGRAQVAFLGGADATARHHGIHPLHARLAWDEERFYAAAWVGSM